MGKKAEKKPVVWVEGGSRRGDFFNRLAVATAINTDYMVLEDSGGFHSLTKPDGKKVKLPGFVKPDIYVTGGRDSLGNKKGVLKIHLQMPDVVIAARTAEHMDFSLTFSCQNEIDDHKGFRYDTIPSRVNAAALQEGAALWKDQLSAFKEARPVYFLILGGGTEKATRTACQQVKQAMEKTGGSLLITSSPRSEHSVKTAVSQEMQDIQPQYFFDWDADQQKGNPYMGMLELADKIIVPSDSLSMPSDAIAAGKEVYIYWGTDRRKEFLKPATFPEQLKNEIGLQASHLKYHTNLYEKGLVHSMDDLVAGKAAPPPAPQNSAQAIADVALTQLKLQREWKGYSRTKPHLRRQYPTLTFENHATNEAVNPAMGSSSEMPSGLGTHGAPAEPTSATPSLNAAPAGGWVKSLFGGMLPSQKSDGMAK